MTTHRISRCALLRHQQRTTALHPGGDSLSCVIGNRAAYEAAGLSYDTKFD